jgi:dephospho-CoA kinase
MLLVGLTGGIASGKSTVGLIFQELGVHLVDADQVSRDLVQPDSPGWDEIMAAFGPAVFQENGQLNRQILGDLVFSDVEKRRRLERILHPRIADEIARRVNKLRREHPDGIIMVDAALMIEVDQHENFDCLVVVFTDAESQVSRLTARDGMGKAEAYRRIEAQMPLTDKIRHADYVIDNSGSPENTRAEVERVFKELMRCAKRGNSGERT